MQRLTSIENVGNTLQAQCTDIMSKHIRRPHENRVTRKFSITESGNILQTHNNLSVYTCSTWEFFLQESILYKSVQHGNKDIKPLVVLKILVITILVNSQNGHDCAGSNKTYSLIITFLLKRNLKGHRFIQISIYVNNTTFINSITTPSPENLLTINLIQ